MNTKATCTNCGEVIVRSTSVPVWGHIRPILAGSTLCTEGRGKATPA